MDAIVQDLHIPRKHVRATKHADRFTVLAHRSWLSGLVAASTGQALRKLPEFPVNEVAADECPATSVGVWTTVHLSVIKKHSQKVILLSNYMNHPEEPEPPLGFSQLLQYISNTNYQHLWKAAYNKYSASRPKSEANAKHDYQPSATTSTMAPYETVLRECIIRMFGQPIIQLTNSDSPDPSYRNSIDTESHPNLYGLHAAIETASHFYLVHSDFVETTLLDCITYSPAILAASYNKPMFIIYQLLHLVRWLHDRRLYLGNVDLNDIFLTENLWLKVRPRVEANLIQPDPSKCEEVVPITFNNPREQHSIKDYCEMWCHGHLSNFDYLTILNNLSGRRLGCPGSHHIMPWVTDFVSRSGTNWRDLKKSKYRLNKGDAQLDQMFSQATSSDVPHHVSDVLSEITFFVYMARRTPKTVLCKHVRPIWVPAEYPASIQRLQSWTPDECVPEFFSEPAVFKSVHEDLPDLEVPAWASCPEDFVAKHREALESQHVSERLHHWIDLNFGYKLTGSAAIKAKNVCLSLVNDHKTLGDRGVVQLFACAHPPRRYPSPWTAKEPPRIYSQEARRRLTRSSEDLSMKPNPTPTPPQPAVIAQPKPSPRVFQSPSTSVRSPSQSRSNRESSMERSTSYHINVQKYQNQIILPKDFNPVAALVAVENMEQFMCKTFHRQSDVKPSAELSLAEWSSTEHLTRKTDILENSFTNLLFSETYEDLFLHKNSKRFLNTQHKNDILRRSRTTQNFHQLMAENRVRDLQVLGCIVVELFLADKLRPIGGLTSRLDFEARLSVCITILKQHSDQLPRCVRYPVRVLLQLDPAPISDRGLPPPTAHLFLQPLLNNILFPFPLHYSKVYTLVASLVEFEETARLLNHKTFIECDGIDCSAFVPLERVRVAFHRKIAECKVLSCAAQVERLLEPIGHEQFEPVELVLPHIIDLLRNDETSTLTAWHLFDSVSIAIGQTATLEHLLQPILRLYDAETVVERSDFLNLNFDSSTSAKLSAGSTFRSRKTGKLYHHSFLLRLIVRFGLAKFLENFVAPLIEAVGGYKEPEDNIPPFHQHQKFDVAEESMKKSRSTRTFKYDEDGSFELPSAELNRQSIDTEEEMFAFDDDALAKANLDDDYEANSAILKIIDQLDPQLEGSILDLRLNHSTAEEATETTPLVENQSFCERDVEIPPALAAATSPTIAIPTFRRSTELNTIDCEIGSKKSVDSRDFLVSAPDVVHVESVTVKTNVALHTRRMSTESRRGLRSSNSISDTAAQSLIWLSHRLGPVLTARHLTRNLLKMLTLCYVGQENLLPIEEERESMEVNLDGFSMSDGRVVGDENAVKVLECLTAISALFGDQFVLLQYLPHVSELIALCKKRITPSLEGGLISSLQLLKFLVPCLSDSTIMDRLHDTILDSIVNPIIRILGSSRYIMPSGYLARSVLARKLLDAVYVLAVRIGLEMTKDHLCIPLQRFFLIFDKSYGVCGHIAKMNLDGSPCTSSDDSGENRHEHCTRGMCVKGTREHVDRLRSERSHLSNKINSQNDHRREQAQEEIADVFDPSLAHVSYVAFLNFLGDTVMTQVVKNQGLILNLCHTFEQPNYATENRNIPEVVSNKSGRMSRTVRPDRDVSGNTPTCSNSFGTPVIGNRIEVSDDDIVHTELIGPAELLDHVTYKYDQINTARHLRGNWLAYWEHEIGRSDKDTEFNLKQIKLQTFSGHGNSVKSLLCLDNENSFMSASKDKTVKLWSLRSEGDGSKVSTCQFTYTNHRKSVHSLAFLDAMRLTVSCDSGVHLWDPFVGTQVGQLDSHKLTPVSVVKTFPAPSPLVLAGTAESTIKIIDARTLSYVTDWKVSMSSSGSVRCIAVAPSGAWIACGLSSGQLILLDARTGLVIATWRATDGELLQLLAPNDAQLLSSSLDNNICVWSSRDGSLMFQMKNPTEPAHCILNNGHELIFGTPANRIGIFPSITREATHNVTKLRSDTFKGVLTSMAMLPLNRMLLVGGDSGMISLIC